MRTFISKVLSVLLLVVAAGSVAPLASAQGNQTYQQRWLFASDYGQWSIPSQQPNTYQWSPSGICLASAPQSSTAFLPFATNAPVLIIDATPANNEVVTPSAVTATSTYCSFTASPSHSHYSFQVQSGTGGLQEALNRVPSAQYYKTPIWIDKNWYTLAAQVPGTSPSAIIAAVAGNSKAYLIDNTTVPFTYYGWNGTAYVTQGTPTGGSAKPTGTVGAASGTSPTFANASGGNGNVFDVNDTTGTATLASGTLFTETWAATTGFNYLPACVVTQTSVNAYTSFSYAVTWSTDHAVLTVTATGAPTASTAYVFHVSCN